MKTLGKMSPEERKEMGPALNGLKNRLGEAISARKELLKDEALNARLASETVDVSQPLRNTPAEEGRIHPITQVTEELTAIVADMGFSVAEGPDIETDELNFTALNFPEGHPAREMHDTFSLMKKRWDAHVAAHAHLSGSDPHHAQSGTTAAHYHSGPHIPL